jgi:hypothetical protein
MNLFCLMLQGRQKPLSTATSSTRIVPVLVSLNPAYSNDTVIALDGGTAYEQLSQKWFIH